MSLTDKCKWYRYYDLEQEIWYIKFGKRANKNEFESFLIQYESRYITFNKKSIIFNGLDIEYLSVSQCIQLANMMRRMRPIHSLQLICFCIVVNNNIIINLLNFIFTIVIPVRPYIICDNIEIAKKFIHKQNEGL